jgi:hypothetical protein
MNGLKHFAHVTICLPLDFIQKRELSGGAILFREYHTLRVLLYSLTRAPHSLTSSRREKKELIWSENLDRLQEVIATTGRPLRAHRYPSTNRSHTRH